MSYLPVVPYFISKGLSVWQAIMIVLITITPRINELNQALSTTDATYFRKGLHSLFSIAALSFETWLAICELVIFLTLDFKPFNRW